jgi:hypothetical protein
LGLASILLTVGLFPAVVFLTLLALLIGH